MPIQKARHLELTIADKKLGYTCNNCGDASDEEDLCSINDFHVFRPSGGFGTSFPSDGDTVEFVVCGKCLKTWCDTFQIPVDYLGNFLGMPTPFKATVEHTGEAVTVAGGWLFYGEPRFKPIPEAFYDHDWPRKNEGPADIVHEHYKGKFYEVVETALLAGTSEPYVIYRGLYGDSKVWARPLSSWNELVMKYGPSGDSRVPRFKGQQLKSMI